MIRPDFGQYISASDRLMRRITTRPKKYGSVQRKVWARWGDLPLISPKPLSGIYAGFRTYADGIREWDSEAGWIFYPEKYYEVWLIIPNERQNPVPVFPDDIDQVQECL